MSEHATDRVPGAVDDQDDFDRLVRLATEVADPGFLSAYDALKARLAQLEARESDTRHALKEIARQTAAMSVLAERLSQDEGHTGVG